MGKMSKLNEKKLVNDGDQGKFILSHFHSKNLIGFVVHFNVNLRGRRRRIKYFWKYSICFQYKEWHFGNKLNGCSLPLFLVKGYSAY